MHRQQYLQNSADQAQRVIDQLDRTGSGSSDVRRSAEADKKYYDKQLKNDQSGK